MDHSLRRCQTAKGPARPWTVHAIERLSQQFTMLVYTPATLRAMDWGVYPKDDRDQADWKIADAAIAQMKSLPPKKPFFLAVGFRLPHVPCFASQQWFDRFPPEDQIILPPVKEHDRDDVPEFAWYLHWKLPEPRLSWLKKAQQWRPLARAYLASTTFMDSQAWRRS